MKKFFLFVIVICSSVLVAKERSDESLPFVLLPINELINKPLEGSYILLELDVDGTAPSIEIRSLNLSFSNATLEKAKFGQWKNQVSLKNFEKGLYLLQIPSGVYQISNISAPYYDLPFKLDTDLSLNWRFKVASDKINYIGRLQVKRERSTRYVDVSLKNRFASSLESLVEFAKSLKTPKQIANGTPYKDNFIDNYTI